MKFFIKNFSTQEENIEILKQALATCKDLESKNVEDKFEENNLVMSYSYLSGMVESISFNDYVSKYIVHLDHSKMRKEPLESSKQFDLLRDFANAATKPNVMELIIKNLLN